VTRPAAATHAGSAATHAGSAPRKSALLARLEHLGSLYYHHRHPFNLLMHAGRLDRGDLRLWVANRYYYQTRIPIKDALIVAKSEDQSFRRAWTQRLLDHDGSGDALDPSAAAGRDPGGLSLWRRLAAGLGLSLAELQNDTELLPAVKSACDDYVELVRSSDLVSAVAASLTEYFSSGLMQMRVDAWEKHYPYVSAEALSYFRQRVAQAPKDADHALWFVETHATSEDQRQRCLAAFERKCEILWRLLDAVYISRRLGRRPRLEKRAWLMKLSELCRGVADEQTTHSPGILLVPEKALQLNQTAFELLERCGGDATLADVLRDLAQEHAMDLRAVELDVSSFVGELERRRILVFEE
jgi:pyrroloquinoline-quinone synthase